MNYVWEVIIKALGENIDPSNIWFSDAKKRSPYMESSFSDLNASEVTTNVEVNPFYRFEGIFSPLVDGSLDKYPELGWNVFNIFVQFLGILDLKQGLCNKEYYGQLLEKEKLSNENFITSFKPVFSLQQKHIILEHMVKLYTIGSSMELIKSLIGQLFSSSIVYEDSIDKRTALLYLGVKKNDDLESLINYILQLFLPLGYDFELFWNIHFGIIGVDETLLVDDFMIY